MPKIQYKFEVIYYDNSILKVDWNDDDTFVIAGLPGASTPERITDGINLLTNCVKLARKYSVKTIELLKQP